MNASLLVICVCLVVCAAALPFPIPYFKGPEHFLTLAPETLPPAMFYTEQKLDHFDGESTATYSQRYFMNNTFYKPGGPVFLYIEGEGAASPYDALVGEHMELAAEFGALVFAVEHRYYGASVPTEDMSTPNMKWLSSQQALADLAQFHKFATDTYNLDGATWICYGGSYPGALSAWFRLKYPHLVYAAVASSAPVRAKLNFEGYNDVVAASLATPLVGGSAECAATLKSGFAAIVDDLQTPGGRQNLSTSFSTCSPLVSASDYDSMTFLNNLAGEIMEIVQYNAEIAGSPTIADVCGAITGTGLSTYEALVHAYKMAHPSGCMDISFADSLTTLLNTTVDREASGVGIRQWTYQTCTQFGFYQTCDANTTCPFGGFDLTLAFNTDLCEIAFGILPENIQPLIDFSNDYYGADHPDGSRILFVNGHIDPWHYLSVLAPLPGTTETAVFINGTAHCANMMPSRATDPPALKAARAKITAQVGTWIKAASMQ